MFFLLANSLFQVGIWATVFVLVGQFERYQDAFYHSAVNFSTLGYGDIVMDTPWHILGALEAISGVLMLGLSTATYLLFLANCYNYAASIVIATGVNLNLGEGFSLRLQSNNRLC